MKREMVGMESNKETLITPRTSVIFPHYDSAGKLCAKVLIDGQFVSVDMSPTNMVDLSLRYFGSSLRGAFDGSKSILGEKISMPPVVVNERLKLYWFPTKSPSSDDCIWLSLGHIYKYVKVDKGHSKVILTDGSSVTIPLSLHSFERRYQRAGMLKLIIEGRIRQHAYYEQANGVTYSISKDAKKRNFDVSES